MVNVYTNNGQFNISESLMEAIKVNNPELLMEKEENRFNEKQAVEDSQNIIYNVAMSDYMSDNDINNPNDLTEKDLDNIQKLFTKYKKDIKLQHRKDFISHEAKVQQDIAQKAIDQEEKDRKEARQRKIDKYMRDNNIDDASDQILFQQILKNGGKISDGIEIDGVKLSKKQIGNRIMKNPYFRKYWKEYQKNIDAQKELQSNKEEIDKVEKETSLVDKDYAPDTLEELLNSQRLIDEINVIESSAKKLVITAKESISSILGLFGNTQRNISSNLKKNVPINDNNQQVPLKKAANESLESDDYMLNEDDSYIPLTAVNDNTMDSYKSNKTGLGKKFGAFGALATGGFNLQPLFDGSVKDKKNFGICMKYYKEYTPSENKKSLVDNLMKYLILKHSNIDMFNDNIKEETIKLHPDLKNSKRKINEVIQKLSVDLDNISAKFLSNVVYKLEIGNDNTFNEILRAVRFAPKLKERYDIRNESKLQIFGIREQALIFQDSNIKSVVGIFISIPLLAKATELAKQAMKLGRHFKNIKA